MSTTLRLSIVALSLLAAQASADVRIVGSASFKHKFDTSIESILKCKECRNEIKELQRKVREALAKNSGYTVTVTDQTGANHSDTNQVRRSVFELKWDSSDDQTTDESDCFFEDAADSLAHELVHIYDAKHRRFTNNNGFISSCQREYSAMTGANMYRRCIGECQRTAYKGLDSMYGCPDGDVMPTPPPQCECDETGINGPLSCAAAPWPATGASFLECCDKHCVAKAFDSKNCGACGNVCTNSRQCDDGQCSCRWGPMSNAITSSGSYGQSLARNEGNACPAFVGGQCYPNGPGGQCCWAPDAFAACY